MRVDALLLCGPTASGKSEWALQLAEHSSIEIVSVDATQVYRGLDIGSAKPSSATRARVPHHLIDLRDPHERYSAGEFVRDAVRAIREIRARGRMPVLVGGTMLYFNALLRGLAEVPTADPAIRAEIDAEAAQRGWPAMHAKLAEIDPLSASRIHPNDPQRIQRALEVFRASRRPLSDWQRETAPGHGLQFARWALVPADRQRLHERIAARFRGMVAAGLPEEIRALQRDPRLHPGLPALRAVGYRQMWTAVADDTSLETSVTASIVATRQLAKRQFTWIHADTGWERRDPFVSGMLEAWLAEARSVIQRAASGT